MSTHMQNHPSLPCGRALSTSNLAPRGGKFPTCQIRHTSRSAFTLVELLVVILIVAMLAALVTPAVMRAQVAARNAAIKAEIDMLHMAIMNYKNEYGSFPPCISSASQNDWAAKHVKRLFPRVADITTQVTAAVNPANSLYGWLQGYTNDPTQPIVNGGTRQKLFDFDQSRAQQLAGGDKLYYPSGKPGSPYIYIDSRVYKANDGTPGKWPLTDDGAFTYTVNGKSYRIEEGEYRTQVHPVTGAYFNDQSFQILSAGRDEEFGTPDDLSNFWPGTRQDFSDSLK